MRVYLDVVVLLNFLVDLLLLLGANRLAGYPPGVKRAVLAAAVGGVYGGACLLPGFSFLGNLFWRLVSLGLMGLLAFGWNAGTLRRTVLFVLLSMALGGIAMGLGHGGAPALLGAAVGMLLLCAVGFREGAGGNSLVEVELRYGDKKVRLLALRDTGNTLRDPVTGQQVLVAGAGAAHTLLGLTAEQLRHPVETLSQRPLPGLRLIPYSTVGRSGGMLLGIRLPEVKIGNSRRAAIVAFAPEGLDGKKPYQALTGGAV